MLIDRDSCSWIQTLRQCSQISGKNGISDTNRDTIETNRDTIPDASDLKAKWVHNFVQCEKQGYFGGWCDYEDKKKADAITAQDPGDKYVLFCAALPDLVRGYYFGDQHREQQALKSVQNRDPESDQYQYGVLSEQHCYVFGKFYGKLWDKPSDLERKISKRVWARNNQKNNNRIHAAE